MLEAESPDSFVAVWSPPQLIPVDSFTLRRISARAGGMARLPSGCISSFASISEITLSATTAYGTIGVRNCAAYGVYAIISMAKCLSV